MNLCKISFASSGCTSQAAGSSENSRAASKIHCCSFAALLHCFLVLRNMALSVIDSKMTFLYDCLFIHTDAKRRLGETCYGKKVKLKPTSRFF